MLSSLLSLLDRVHGRLHVRLNGMACGKIDAAGKALVKELRSFGSEAEYISRTGNAVPMRTASIRLSTR